ncbi:MAG TPA: CoA transferase [Candidatus Margulisiibacteriota bacterium]|nr:CoA transferase [Candidatus Margulisiibacteriota bacterium]
MPGPLAGIRVVEMGFWVAGPGAAGVMADWGADVVKIEPPEGDPFRGMFMNAAGLDVPFNPPFELDNRGKRSIGLNLQHPDGRAIAQRLLRDADVFVSNLRQPALCKVGLSYDAVRVLNPRLVYCHVSGYGLDGDDSNRPAYDIGAFWSRAGIAASLVPSGSEPPQQRGGMGDHTTALSAVGAVCAALVARQRTGEGQLVSTSLLRTGMYVLGWDMNIRLRYGKIAPPYTRFDVPNPVVNSYRAADGKWFWLLGLQGDRHWPDLVRAVDRPELLDDPRFRDIKVRRENAPVLVPILDAIFATKPLHEWTAIFDRENVWWAPVQTPDEVAVDPQMRAAGGVVRAPVADADGGAEMVASPADFQGTPWQPAGAAPEFAQHTEEVLLELGYDWEAIAKLKEAGAIP